MTACFKHDGGNVKNIIGTLIIEGLCVSVPDKVQAQDFIDKKVTVKIFYYEDDTSSMTISDGENKLRDGFMGIDNFDKRSPRVQILSHYKKNKKQCYTLIQN